MSTRTYPKRRLLVTITLIGALLFHWQTVFACKMMELSAKAEACCCKQNTSIKVLQSIDENLLDDSCCEFSGELSMNGIENDTNPYINQITSIEFPQPLFVAVLLSLWPPAPSNTPTLLAYYQFDLPNKSHTPPYLTTQRLRI